MVQYIDINFYSIYKRFSITGVYKDDGPYNIYMNSSGVKDLYMVIMSQTSLVLGANVSLTRSITAFKSTAKKHPGFSHLDELAKHWSVVANVGVRNVSFSSFFFILINFIFLHYNF